MVEYTPAQYPVSENREYQCCTGDKDPEVYEENAPQQWSPWWMPQAASIKWGEWDKRGQPFVTGSTVGPKQWGEL